MKKKIIVALLALVLVFTFTSKADAQTFTDISKHWAKPYIEYTSNLGYFTGYQDGTFKPNKKITRAEFVTILAKLKGFDNQDYILQSQDVVPNDWFSAYLNDLVALGLIKNGIYFDGSALITRDEAFGLLGQLFPNKTPQANLTFNDSKLVKRVRDFCILKDMGIVRGDNKNKVNPASPLSRAEVASLIYNMQTKNIFIDRDELIHAKENNLFNFDFNVVGLKENYNVGAANDLNNMIDEFKQNLFNFMDNDTNTTQENNVQNQSEISQKSELEKARESKDFVNSYEEALEKLRVALRNREETFTFTYNPYAYKSKYSSAFLATDAVKFKEHFGAVPKSYSESGNKVTLKYEYPVSKDELETYLSQIDDMVRELNGRSDYDKVKYIHDWIVNKTKYAYDQYKSGNYELQNGLNVYSPISIFKYGIAICQGYAETFELLAKEVGLKSQLISGEANNSSGWGGHAWNLVEIDGRLYHIDTTWDDPVSSSGRDMLRYKYFLIDDREMSKDHRWNESKYPSANSGCLNDGLDKNGFGDRYKSNDRYDYRYDDYRYDDGYDNRYKYRYDD